MGVWEHFSWIPSVYVSKWMSNASHACSPADPPLTQIQHLTTTLMTHSCEWPSLGLLPQHLTLVHRTISSSSLHHLIPGPRGYWPLAWWAISPPWSLESWPDGLPTFCPMVLLSHLISWILARWATSPCCWSAGPQEDSSPCYLCQIWSSFSS